MSEEARIEHWFNLMRKVNLRKYHYKSDVIDCSEMSAELERILEAMGFDTYIALNPGTASEPGHCWVLVKTRNSYVTVEATGLFVVTPGTVTTDGWTYSDYMAPESVFGTIYEAEYYYPGEFDWWNSLEVPY